MTSSTAENVYPKWSELTGTVPSATLAPYGGKRRHKSRQWHYRRYALADLSSIKITTYTPGFIKQERQWLLSLHQQLYELKSLPENWNDYGSATPNHVAITAMEHVLDVLHGLEITVKPNRLIPSADDGLALLFINGNKEAMLECGNDNEIVAIIYEHGKHSQIWSVTFTEIAEAMDRIDAYLNG